MYVATKCGYTKRVLAMGVRRAKSELSKLIDAALNGEQVVITNHGKKVVRLVPEMPEPDKSRGIGCLKGVTEYPEHWFTPEGEAAFAALFENVPAGARKRSLKSPKKK